MKKFLLSFVGLFSLLAAQAGSYTITFKSTDTSSDGTGAISNLADFTSDNNIVKSVTVGTGNANKVYLGKQGYGLKLSTSSVNGFFTLTLTDKAQVNVTSIVVNAAPWVSTSQGNPIDAAELSIKIDGEENAQTKAIDTSSKDFANYTFTYNGETKLTSIYVESKKRCYIKSITVNFEGGDITFDEPTVIENVKVASIAALLEATKDLAKGATSTDKYEFTCTLTAVYQNVYSNGIGNNLYVTDGHDYLLVYGTLTNAYKNGDVIPAGVVGQMSNYGGLMELVPVVSSFAAGTAGEAVEPFLTVIDDITEAEISQYIKLENITISGVDGKNFTISNVDETEIAGYNSYGVEVSAGTDLTLIGFVSYRSNNLSVYPTEIISASGKEIVAAPTFSPAAGMVAAGTKVAIECATENAKIYYTLDGTEPSTSSTLYSEPIEITADVTIKAFATCEDMEDSAVAEATFTLPPANLATFDFAAPATLGDYPASTADARTMYNSYTTETEDKDRLIKKDGNNDNYLVNITGVKIYNKNVYVAVNITDENDKGTEARLYYQSAGAMQLRAYKKSSIEIGSTDENNKITKVVMNLNNTTNGFAEATKVTYANKVCTYEPTDAFQTVSLPITTNNMQINTIDVYCQSALSGVENVAVDSENAPVEYYNLQGVRVENPSKGLYIKRQGNKATKVIL